MTAQDAELDGLRHQLMLSMLQGVRTGKINKAFSDTRRDREEYKEKARMDLRGLFLTGIRSGTLHAALRDVKQRPDVISVAPPQYSLLAEADSEVEEGEEAEGESDEHEEMRRNILDTLVHALRVGRLAEVLPSRMSTSTSIPMAAAEECTEQEGGFEEVMSLDSDSDGEEVLEGMAQHYISLAFQEAEAQIDSGLNQLLDEEEVHQPVDVPVAEKTAADAAPFSMADYFVQHFPPNNLGFVHAMFQTAAVPPTELIAEVAAVPLPSSPSKATRSRTIFGGVQRQAKAEAEASTDAEAAANKDFEGKTLLLTGPARGMHRAVLSCPNLLSPSAPPLTLKRADGSKHLHQKSQPLLSKAAVPEKTKIVAAAQLGPLLVKPGAKSRSRSASSAVSAVALDLGLNLLPGGGLWPTTLPGVVTGELSPMKVSKAGQGILPSLGTSSQKPFNAWELSPHKSLRSFTRSANTSTNF
mmetsp:Transcript_21143/g.45843  ORF Transcript_21143/g.45843 Transcript_21143/m.45843 type:complete len:470 (+) Transcript_21143:134-1543(+)|eukprot:CAMPEP_0206438544 /NCGR_PEP_ID=MMETSP0324_2-20121206/11694_1 /ASSEMBLY_ACC=CAM_ASM_000836 /TAXON_ID=2866 /ORGANISM="Crypthecodinium cohnii, Strain Seligo" /LENGTH=469 /DNA_ID=CAMNT_0053906025 /DNA_START=59 /DNA_END=1468 /DNA_ORIENTATION=+